MLHVTVPLFHRPDTIRFRFLQRNLAAIHTLTSDFIRSIPTSSTVMTNDTQNAQNAPPSRSVSPAYSQEGPVVSPTTAPIDMEDVQDTHAVLDDAQDTPATRVAEDYLERSAHPQTPHRRAPEFSSSPVPGDPNSPLYLKGHPGRHASVYTSSDIINVGRTLGGTRPGPSTSAAALPNGTSDDLRTSLFPGLPASSSNARESTPPATAQAPSALIDTKTPAPLKRSAKDLHACQDTPHSRSESATRKERGTNDPLAEERYRDLARDIKPHCVGPIPVGEFLDFLPKAQTDSGEDPTFNFSEFDQMKKKDLEKERDYYLPLVRRALFGL